MPSSKPRAICSKFVFSFFFSFFNTNFSVKSKSAPTEASAPKNANSIVVTQIKPRRDECIINDI
jgi:hypothetical protein